MSNKIFEKIGITFIIFLSGFFPFIALAFLIFTTSDPAFTRHGEQLVSDWNLIGRISLAVVLFMTQVIYLLFLHDSFMYLRSI